MSFWGFLSITKIIFGTLLFTLHFTKTQTFTKCHTATGSIVVFLNIFFLVKLKWKTVILTHLQDVFYPISNHRLRENCQINIFICFWFFFCFFHFLLMQPHDMWNCITVYGNISTHSVAASGCQHLVEFCRTQTAFQPATKVWAEHFPTAPGSSSPTLQVDLMPG